jgi:hypothetical protein
VRGVDHAGTRGAVAGGDLEDGRHDEEPTRAAEAATAHFGTP